MARFSRPLTHHCVLPSKWWRVPESNWSGRGMNPASSPNDPQRWEGKPESNRTGNSFKGCWRHQPPASPQYREWDSNPHCTHFECAASCHWATSAKSAREVNRIAYLQQMGLARISSQITSVPSYRMPPHQPPPAGVELPHRIGLEAPAG